MTAAFAQSVVHRLTVLLAALAILLCAVGSQGFAAGWERHAHAHPHSHGHEHDHSSPVDVEADESAPQKIDHGKPAFDGLTHEDASPHSHVVGFLSAVAQAVAGEPGLTAVGPRLALACVQSIASRLERPPKAA